MTHEEAINMLIAVAVCSTEYLYCDEHCPFYPPENSRACREWNDIMVKEAVETILTLRAQQKKNICGCTNLECASCTPGPCEHRKEQNLSKVSQGFSQGQDNAPLTGWIRVKDKPPAIPPDKIADGYVQIQVLVWCDNGRQCAWFQEDTKKFYDRPGWLGIEVDNVTHWMPLPEPPEEGMT